MTGGDGHQAEEQSPVTRDEALARKDQALARLTAALADLSSQITALNQELATATDESPDVGALSAAPAASAQLLSPTDVLEPREGEAPVMSAAEGSRAVKDELAGREQAFRTAMEPRPFAVRLGASNMPHDCSIWAPDWRERLPSRHPERVKAERQGNLRKPGTPGARRTINAAHRALLAAARRTSQTAS